MIRGTFQSSLDCELDSTRETEAAHSSVEFVYNYKSIICGATIKRTTVQPKYTCVPLYSYDLGVGLCEATRPLTRPKRTESNIEMGVTKIGCEDMK
jgi:hypothetical protein